MSIAQFGMICFDVGITRVVVHESTDTADVSVCNLILLFFSFLDIHFSTSRDKLKVVSNSVMQTVLFVT